ncbi:MAG: licheninase [Herbinix sp.]|jgi:beta-glucanase (GH16 family)|nr:licheninase [Herbinix sp.]
MKDLKQGYHLVWSDEFDYEGAPNPDKWSYDLGNHQWANRELQAYTNRCENVLVKDGTLKITARKEKDGDREYTSTRMISYGKQSWQYGLFEFRVKLPKGKGSWPAIWMLSDSIKEGNRWPKCGEIDIVEHTGSHENRLLFSLHSERHNHTRTDTKKYTVLYQQEGVCEEFHDYCMEWTPEYFEFYVDGVSTCRFNKADDTEDQTESAWPFDQKFYLIFNIAVGGTLGGEVDETMLPYVMEVDYVRVYQKD